MIKPGVIPKQAGRLEEKAKEIEKFVPRPEDSGTKAMKFQEGLTNAMKLKIDQIIESF
mgnify:CR=1 FL=1